MLSGAKLRQCREMMLNAQAVKEKGGVTNGAFPFPIVHISFTADTQNPSWQDITDIRIILNPNFLITVNIYNYHKYHQRLSQNFS